MTTHFQQVGTGAVAPLPVDDAWLIERCALHLFGMPPSAGPRYAVLRDLGLSPAQVAHLWTAVEKRTAEILADPNSFDTAALAANARANPEAA